MSLSDKPHYYPRKGSEYRVGADAMKPGFYSTEDLAPDRFPQNREFLGLPAFRKKIDVEKKSYTQLLAKKLISFEQKFGAPTYERVRRDLQFSPEAMQTIEQMWEAGKEKNLEHVDSLYKALYLLFRGAYATHYAGDKQISDELLDRVTELHVLETLSVLLHQDQKKEGAFYEGHAVDVNSVAQGDILSASNADENSTFSEIEVRRGDNLLFVVDANLRVRDFPEADQAVSKARVDHKKAQKKRREERQEIKEEMEAPQFYQTKGTAGDILNAPPFRPHAHETSQGTAADILSE